MQRNSDKQKEAETSKERQERNNAKFREIVIDEGKQREIKRDRRKIERNRKKESEMKRGSRELKRHRREIKRNRENYKEIGEK